MPGSWYPNYMSRNRPLLAFLSHLLCLQAGPRMWNDVTLKAGAHAVHEPVAGDPPRMHSLGSDCPGLLAGGDPPKPQDVEGGGWS